MRNPGGSSLSSASRPDTYYGANYVLLPNGGSSTVLPQNGGTNIGYTMKYNKQGTNIQGNLVLIRHVRGSNAVYRVKSNALSGLALGEDRSVPMGWASIVGKGTYQEPGWPDAIGNYQFTLYVEDRNEPGSGVDRVWIEVRDKNGQVVTVISMPRPAASNTMPLQGGNIVVPHTAR